MLIIFSLTFTGFNLVLARENAAPAFRITGYLQKINADSIEVFVPRTKKAMTLILADKVKVLDFSTQKEFSLKDLRVKDLAVCEGIISGEGFICQSIAFVHQHQEEQ